MPILRIAWKNGGAQHMLLVKKAAAAVIAAQSKIQSESSEGGRERRQAAVVVGSLDSPAPAAVHAAASTGAVPIVRVQGPGIQQPSSSSTTITSTVSVPKPPRRILGPIRHKFKF